MATPPQPPQGSYPPNAPYPPYAPQPPKKTSPIVWILLGIGGFILLCGILAVAGGFYFVHKIKEAGFSSEAMKKNPALATAKILAMTNPDIEVVSSDDDAGTVTLKDKKTGKTVTVDLDQIKKGKITFSGDGNEKVTMQAGGDAQMPEWLPKYPGSRPETSIATNSTDVEAGSFHFTTKDSVEKVTRFYEDEFKKAGLTVKNQTMSTGGTAAGSATGAAIIGEQADGKRGASVFLGSTGDDTTVQVSYQMKK